MKDIKYTVMDAIDRVMLYIQKGTWVSFFLSWSCLTVSGGILIGIVLTALLILMGSSHTIVQLVGLCWAAILAGRLVYLIIDWFRRGAVADV